MVEAVLLALTVRILTGLCARSSRIGEALATLWPPVGGGGTGCGGGAWIDREILADVVASRPEELLIVRGRQREDGHGLPLRGCRAGRGREDEELEGPRVKG
jgi:hypothetical protein